MSRKDRKPSKIKFLLPRRKTQRRRTEFLGGLGVSLVSALVVSIFLTSSIDRFLITSNQYATVLAAVLVDMANGDRTQNSLHPLQMNTVLVAAAQAKANDMAAKSYFAHVSPEGVDPWHWFKEAGYAFDYAGENLAVDFSDSADVERAWMNSPTHRENILNPNFTEIGIATAQGTFQGHPTTFVVQVFGTPSASGVQRPVVAVSIPEAPDQPALASSSPSAEVLGEASKPLVAEVSKPLAKPVAALPAKPTSEKMIEVLGSSVVSDKTLALVDTSSPERPVLLNVAGATPDYAPLWAHIAMSPHSILQYAYWAIALMVVVLLGFATGFEIHVHHTRKAITAGIMLSFILVMFVAANTFVFTTPTLTQNASMAAAASAF